VVGYEALEGRRNHVVRVEVAVGGYWKVGRWDPGGTEDPGEGSPVAESETWVVAAKVECLGSPVVVVVAAGLGSFVEVAAVVVVAAVDTLLFAGSEVLVLALSRDTLDTAVGLDHTPVSVVAEAPAVAFAPLRAV